MRVAAQRDPNRCYQQPSIRKTIRKREIRAKVFIARENFFFFTRRDAFDFEVAKGDKIRAQLFSS